MKKITKKEFTKILTSNRSVRLVKLSSTPCKWELNELMSGLDDRYEFYLFMYEKLTCVEERNWLDFSDGSGIYMNYNGTDEFYRHGKYVIYTSIDRYKFRGEIKTSYNYEVYGIIK